MNRWMFCVLTAHTCFAAAAFGDDYLLRLAALGYADRPASSKAPAEVCLHSIEVVARPEAPFRARAQVGSTSLAIHGALHPKEDGAFRVEFHFDHLVDTGDTRITPAGDREPVFDETSLQSTVVLVPGAASTVATLKTKLADDTGSASESSLRYVMTLVKHAPARQ